MAENSDEEIATTLNAGMGALNELAETQVEEGILRLDRLHGQ